MSEFTQKDRETLNKLVTDMAVATNQLNNLCTVMYGPRADGFLYEFAAMRESIRSIPGMADAVKTMAEQVKSIAENVDKVMPRIKAVENYILRERLRRGFIVTLMSALASVITFVVTVKTGLAEWILHLKNGN